ncbi:MAG: hypothetical protein ACTJGD_06120 [Mesonia hippocampi]|uniref:hypothetical protein n=1 Tax=Mesonia hippocampi TaxID=1628250 RepID=UPI003F9E8DDE
MKNILYFFLFIIPFFSFSQESIKLTYKFPKNSETKMYNALNDIILLSITTEDLNAKGKKFLLRKEEIIKGKVKRNDSLLSCKTITRPIITGKDTLNYVVNACNSTQFFESLEKQEIIFGGKFINDSIKIIINYPGISIRSKLKADDSFVLMTLQEKDKEGSFELKIGEEFPIIALTPPIKGNGYSSYCLIDNKEIKNFYTEYNIDRYYVYYLTIK